MNHFVLTDARTFLFCRNPKIDQNTANKTFFEPKIAEIDQNRSKMSFQRIDSTLTFLRQKYQN